LEGMAGFEGSRLRVGERSAGGVLEALSLKKL
jgi:hypothetical protein